MILPASFSKEWIDSHRQRKGFEKINPPLVEKMIHALALVEALVLYQLDFVFKGGTSLILLLPEPGRFSIDIDIITQATRQDVEKVLDEVCRGKPFTGYTLNEKRSYQPGIPKAHYSLFYPSSLGGGQQYVLLDILFDTHSYPEIFEIPIATEWVKTDESFSRVKVPTHESITGDKLTAFAPNTTGILYNQGKSLEIIKQLYDLGKLFEQAKDLSVVSKSFDQTVIKEIGYRGNLHSREDVLQDIIDTCRIIARREGNKTDPYLENFKELQSGIQQFRSYQMGSFYRIEQAIISSSKVALLAARLKTQTFSPIELYHPRMTKMESKIDQEEYIFLNKLTAEPLFYWKQAIDLIAGQVVN